MGIRQRGEERRAAGRWTGSGGAARRSPARRPRSARRRCTCSRRNRRRRHIEVSDADIDGQIAEIRKNYPNEEAFTKDVAAQGMTIEHAEVADAAADAGAKLVESPDVTGGIQVPDPDVDAFYQTKPRAVQATGKRACQSHPDRAAAECDGAAEDAGAARQAQDDLDEDQSRRRLRRAGARAIQRQQRPERRRPRILPRGQMSGAVRGGRVQAETRRGQRGSSKPSSAFTSSRCTSVAAPRTVAVCRGQRADQAVPRAAAEGAEAAAVCRGREVEGEDSRCSCKTPVLSISDSFPPCRSGETGRRAGLKIP